MSCYRIISCEYVWQKFKILLDNYLGFNKKQIEKIKHVNSRAVAIVKSYPMVVVTEREIIPLSKFV